MTVIGMLFIMGCSSCQKSDSSTQPQAEGARAQDACQVYFNIITSGRSGEHIRKGVYLHYQNGRVEQTDFNHRIIRVSKGRFATLDEETEEFKAANLTKIVARDLTTNDRVILLERPQNIAKSMNEQGKEGIIRQIRAIRTLYPEIDPQTFPLPEDDAVFRTLVENVGWDDENDSEHIEEIRNDLFNNPLIYHDDAHILAIYKNVVYVYDGLLFENEFYSCGFYDPFQEHTCEDIPCLTNVEARVLTIDENGLIHADSHRSSVPEYYDGTGFKPIYPDPLDVSEFEPYEMVKSSVYPMLNGENRSFAFYPYPMNFDEQYPEPMRMNVSTLFAARRNSLGSDDMPYCSHYRNEGMYKLHSGVYDEQSIILHIKDELLPQSVAGIRSDVTKAFNGCGYIDWEKREVVFGKTRHRADWLPYVNGIIWMDSDEVFPMEKLK